MALTVTYHLKCEGGGRDRVQCLHVRPGILAVLEWHFQKTTSFLTYLDLEVFNKGRFRERATVVMKAALHDMCDNVGFTFGIEVMLARVDECGPLPRSTSQQGTDIVHCVPPLYTRLRLTESGSMVLHRPILVLATLSKYLFNCWNRSIYKTMVFYRHFALHFWRDLMNSRRTRNRLTPIHYVQQAMDKSSKAKAGAAPAIPQRVPHHLHALTNGRKGQAEAAESNDQR